MSVLAPRDAEFEQHETEQVRKKTRVVQAGSWNCLYRCVSRLAVVCRLEVCVSVDAKRAEGNPEFLLHREQENRRLGRCRSSNEGERSRTGGRARVGCVLRRREKEEDRKRGGARRSPDEETVTAPDRFGLLSIGRQLQHITSASCSGRRGRLH